MFKTLLDRIARLRNEDSGYTFVAALGVFVLLGATFIMVTGAATNQITQSRMSAQMVQNEMGNDAALRDALSFLNNNIKDANTIPADAWLENKSGNTANNIPTTPAAAKSFTRGDTTYKWYVTPAAAPATHAIVHTNATTLKKSIDREYRIVGAGVSAFRKTGSDGDSIYNVSAVGSWRDAIGAESVENASLRALGSGSTPGTVGLYANHTTDGESIYTTGGFVRYDPRAKVENTDTSSVQFPLTLDLNGKYARPNAYSCPVRADKPDWYKQIWDVNGLQAEPGETVEVMAVPGAPTVKCVMGVDLAPGSTLRVMGGGVLVVYVRDASDANRLAGRIDPLGDSQVHMIFEGTRGAPGRDVVLGDPSTTVSSKNLFVYAPESKCKGSNADTRVTMTGSIVCKTVERFDQLQVTHVAPKIVRESGPNQMVYTLDFRQ